MLIWLKRFCKFFKNKTSQGKQRGDLVSCIMSVDLKSGEIIWKEERRLGVADEPFLEALRSCS